jgi:hypothetical protein
MKKISGKIIALLAAVQILTGCAVTRYTYDVTLDHVDAPPAMAISGDTQTGLHYKDQIGQFVMFFYPEQISIRIKNQTNKAITVNWNEASISDTTGSISRIIHKGVRFIDRSSPMPPTVIPGESSLEDIAFPSDSIFWNSNTKEWDRIPMLPAFAPQGLAPEQAEKHVASFEGKTISFYLPIIWNEKKYEYNFKFKVKNAQILKRENK